MPKSSGRGVTAERPTDYAQRAQEAQFLLDYARFLLLKHEREAWARSLEQKVLNAITPKRGGR